MNVKTHICTHLPLNFAQVEKLSFALVGFEQAVENSISFQKSSYEAGCKLDVRKQLLE